MKKNYLYAILLALAAQQAVLAQQDEEFDLVGALEEQEEVLGMEEPALEETEVVLSDVSLDEAEDALAEAQDIMQDAALDDALADDTMEEASLVVESGIELTPEELEEIQEDVVEAIEEALDDLEEAKEASPVQSDIIEFKLNISFDKNTGDAQVNTFEVVQ